MAASRRQLEAEAVVFKGATAGAADPSRAAGTATSTATGAAGAATAGAAAKPAAAATTADEYAVARPRDTHVEAAGTAPAPGAVDTGAGGNGGVPATAIRLSMPCRTGSISAGRERRGCRL